jgi:Family of unknown function (DUF5681)
MAKNKRPDVGYGRPPAEFQFKPGQSGNPRGRPKGSKSLESIIYALANKKVTITENGKRRSVSKIELALTQLINKAATGSERSIDQFIGLLRHAQPPAQRVAFTNENDAVHMKNIEAKLRKFFDDTEGDQ